MDNPAKNEKTNEEDVLVNENVVLISLAQLYFEEVQGALQIEQNNFMLVQNMYKGGSSE